MRIISTYTGSLIPDTISKKKKPIKHPRVVPDGGVTQGTTKSGTIIYVEGENATHRKRALQYFLKVYNNDFSKEEQKKNGNLLYKLKSKIGIRHAAASATAAIPDKTERKKYQITGRMIFILTFTNESSKLESTITHELIHVRKYANNKFKRVDHNEGKIDFETVGRMSKEGLKQDISSKTPYNGVYYNIDNKVLKQTHYGNECLAKLKLPRKQKFEIAAKGKLNDRKLLTGSINTNIVGNTAVTRTEKLFPKSFLNQKIVINRRK